MKNYPTTASFERKDMKKLIDFKTLKERAFDLGERTGGKP
jgi:hypothetical protein